MGNITTPCSNPESPKVEVDFVQRSPAAVAEDQSAAEKLAADKARAEAAEQARIKEEEAKRLADLAQLEEKEKQAKLAEEALEAAKAQAAAENDANEATNRAAREAKEALRKEVEQRLQESKNSMKKRTDEKDQKKCRYDFSVGLPKFTPGTHVPTLGLLNPASGSKAGSDILAVAWKQEYYKDNFFDIIDCVRFQKPGGMLDVFRTALNAAKEEGKKQGLRPRIVTGGGDGTCSFGMFILFLALKAHPDREDTDLSDTGNGFIWTDEEMEKFFPAFAQMPLGSGNDLANFMGWGKKYPGDGSHGLIGSCHSKIWSAARLSDWIGGVLDKKAIVANFDVWGLMPSEGDECNFKICELAGPKGISPKVKGQLTMKPADNPVPFFVVLYANVGWLGYEIARFQINRRSAQVYNDLEHTRQAVASFLEFRPPQIQYGMKNCAITADGEPYFPPRGMKADQGGRYMDVGFMNINSIVGGHIHAGDRTGCGTRCLACGTCSFRSGGPKFNDGEMDLWRIKGPIRTIAKNPGTTVQSDKKKSITFSYEAAEGQGVFMQYDGESRFLFSPKGEKFGFTVRKALNVPMVIGAGYNKKQGGDPDNGQPVTFAFCGDNEGEVQAVKRRVWKLLAGQLNGELLATADEIKGAKFPM